jgi:hypothetical protein
VSSAAEAIAQRLHDLGIDRALTAWLDGSGGTAPKVGGVLGSHATPRHDPQFTLVADLGWRLGERRRALHRNKPGDQEGRPAVHYGAL